VAVMWMVAGVVVVVVVVVVVDDDVDDDEVLTRLMLWIQYQLVVSPYFIIFVILNFFELYICNKTLFPHTKS